MACSNLTSGLFLDCIDGTGGIEKVFIANGKVVSFAHTNGLVTAITTGAGALDPSDFFEFEIPKQTGSLSETINVSQENGTLFYDQALSLVFNRLDLEKRNQIALIAKSNDMVVVAKDNNGNYLERTPKDMHIRLAKEFERIEKIKFEDEEFRSKMEYELAEHMKKL
jgi:hypothetical protein